LKQSIPRQQPFDGANGVVLSKEEYAAQVEELTESEYQNAFVGKIGKHYLEARRLTGGQLYLPAVGKELTEKLAIKGKVRVAYVVVTNDRILKKAIEKGDIKPRGIWIKLDYLEEK
jgi:hypothetical protein